MNKAQREEVAKLVGQLADLKSQAETIGQALGDLASDEQGKFDNMPEGLQQSDNGQAIETAAQTLSEAADFAESGDIGAAIDALEGLE